MNNTHSSISINEQMKRHYEMEDKALELLLKLEHQFREHYSISLKELHMQKEIVDRLWVLTQRYIILQSSGSCGKYPDIYAAPAEDVILSEYNEKLKSLRASNCRLVESVNHLRISCRMFEGVCSKLDMTAETPFILGSAFHKPISFFIELISDLFKYFHALIRKLKYLSHMLDPSEIIGLEEYRIVLDPSQDFEEYLMKGLCYCKCLRPKPTCDANYYWQ